MRRAGDLVAVKDFEGATLIRRIVDIEGDVLLVCTDEEYVAAKRERRTPVSIGFKSAYIIPDHKVSKETAPKSRHGLNAKRHKG